MNVKLKIEILKLFLLEFELKSEKKEEESVKEDTDDNLLDALR